MDVEPRVTAQSEAPSARNIERKLARNKEYREAYERLIPFEQIARMVIMHRYRTCAR
jgi:hypothetical protein